MKKISLLFLLAFSLLFSAACQLDVNKAVSAAGDAYNAVSVSDEQLKKDCRAMRELGDKENKVAGASNAYTARLNKIVAKFKNVEGNTLNYKVYLTSDVNANATADGSIRVYSGLMDLMTDDELRFVIGHEIGHVVKGHSLNATRMAYGSSAVIKGASSAGGTIGALTESQLGGLLHTVINAQFSQSQETDSDDYGLKLLKENGYDTQAAVTALQKLAKLGGQGSITSSHPDPTDRAERMAAEVAKLK